VKTERLTASQALVRFLANQYVERDGVEHRFFGGCFGIFGHGNVGGIGEAPFQRPDLHRATQLELADCAVSDQLLEALYLWVVPPPDGLLEQPTLTLGDAEHPRRAPSGSRVSGFSQSTCLPAWRARIDHSTWNAFGSEM